MAFTLLLLTVGSAGQRAGPRPNLSPPPSPMPPLAQPPPPLVRAPPSPPPAAPWPTNTADQIVAVRRRRRFFLECAKASSAVAF